MTFASGESIAETGFEILPGALSDAECDDLLARFSELGVRKSRAGARHLLFVFSVLALDQRIRSIAERVLGGAAIPFRITLFNKSIESNWSVVWHQDTALPLRQRFERPGWGPWSEKAGVLYAHAPTAALSRVVALRVHLDESARTNGPLRVLPGSHLFGVLSDDEVSEIAHSATAVDCLVPRGGVLAMRPLLIHSSSKVCEPRPRRVLHIEYSGSLSLGNGIELAAA